MTTKIARPLVRFTVLAVLAMAAGGCSTMASLDPTGLLSDNASPTPSDQFPSDTSAAQPNDTGTTTPDLASLPARPATPTTAAQQQQMAQAVTADGTQAQYSADALKAGTEAAAPPPGGAPVMMAAAPTAAPTASDLPPTAGDSAPPSASDAPPSASEAPSAARPVGVAGTAPAVGPRVARPVGAEPSAADQAAAAAMAAAPTASAPVAAAPTAAPPMAVANAASGGEAAVPAVPAGAAGVGNTRMAMLSPPVVSDAALGFKPSAAPPLDPSISNWVSAPILAHYRRTALLAGSAGTSSAAVPAVGVAPARGAVKGAAKGVGGPDMSGAVVANMDALSSAAAGAIAANYGGVPPTAIVYFPGDGISLSPAARSQVRQAVAAFKAGGGAGNVRVVGHASSRTANMPVERHLEAIFEKSQKRASAVANELIHEGIPAAQVMVEAVGDSQPIYYESMPKGEDGNRRTEIFVQS